MILAEKFLDRIRGRLIRRNKNWLAIVCGETGSGKSYSALSLADFICPRGITVRRNVVFDPIGFIEKIANKKDLMKGDILIFDEAGVGIASRDWYSIQNKLLGSVLQTFRHLNIGVIFTTPNLSFIDIQARKLFHNYFETVYLNYEEKICYHKLFDIQHNSRYDKTYFKHPKFVSKKRKTVSLGYIGIPKPRASLIREYEKVKTEFTAKLNERVLKELTEPRQAKKGYDIKEIIKEVKSNKKDYLKIYGSKNIIDADKIVIKYGLGRSLAYTIKKSVEESLKT